MNHPESKRGKGGGVALAFFNSFLKHFLVLGGRFRATLVELRGQAIWGFPLSPLVVVAHDNPKRARRVEGPGDRNEEPDGRLQIQ